MPQCEWTASRAERRPVRLTGLGVEKAARMLDPMAIIVNLGSERLDLMPPA
jgi:hypothetical protein